MEFKCKNCKVFHAVLYEATPSCCAWYLDNVVCGDKTVDDCLNYEEVRR